MAWRKWLVRTLVLFIAGTAIAAALAYLSWTNPTAVREQVIARLRAQFPGAVVNLESARFRLLGGITVNELHLTPRSGSEPTELAYVPRVTIDPDKEMFSKGKLAIRRVDWQKAKLHVIGGPDGSWNRDGILAEPDPKQPVPTMVFKQATLVVE